MIFTFIHCNLTVHFIGEITGAVGFRGASLFAKWKLYYDSRAWRVLEGHPDGRTWIAERSSAMEVALWNEPIQISMACIDLRGWPKLLIEIYSVDENAYVDFAGYAWTHLPTCPGEHSLDLSSFCPSGSFYDQFVSLFLGGRPRYEDPMVVLTPESRIGHEVMSVGMVTVKINVIHRSFPDVVIFTPEIGST